jgi:hypothetical protein
MMLSPRQLNGKPRTPGGMGSNGSSFRYLSRQQQQSALQDDLTALKRGSLSHDILDVAQFVDETPDAGDAPSFPSLSSNGFIPPAPPPPYLSATSNGRYQSPRAEIEDSYRISSRRAAAARASDSPLRTPPTPATPSIGIDPKSNAAFRFLRNSDRVRPSDLQPSPDLASDRLGPRRKAMLAQANQALNMNNNINLSNSSSNSMNPSMMMGALPPFGLSSHAQVGTSGDIGIGVVVGDKEVDAKESLLVNGANVTTGTGSPSNAAAGGAAIRPVKQPRSSPAALLSKLRIQDEELKKSGTDGKSPQYGGDNDNSLANITNNANNNNSGVGIGKSNSFARPPSSLPLNGGIGASPSIGISSISGMGSIGMSSPASMFMTSPPNALAYLPASSSTLPVSAFGGLSPSASPLTGYGSLPQFTTISPALGYGAFGTPTGSTFGLSPGMLLGARTVIGQDGSPVDAADAPGSSGTRRRMAAAVAAAGARNSPTPFDFEYTESS